MRNLLMKLEPMYRPEDGAGSESQQQQQAEPNGDGSTFDLGKAYAELPEDSRAWLSKQGFDKVENLPKLAKQVYEQDKHIGGMIKIPGDDATDEERNAFQLKLGRPETVDGYEFDVPADLPENLPYDGERADAFKAVAHKLGLSSSQAQGLHDWFVGTATEDFNMSADAIAEQRAELAAAETTKLVKRWGPLDGEQAKANLELADRFLTNAGGEAAVEALKAAGLIGPNKEILSEPLAVMFADAGAVLYKEDGLLTGHNGNKVGNPFADGESNNLTEAMQIIKRDPDEARSLIAAAGKKPSDFGLKME